MNNNAECAQYLRSRLGFHRLLLEFRKKWKTYGKVTGTVTLKNVSSEERQAIGGILGKVFYESDIRVPFSAFEKGLQRTKYGQIDMKAVLEAYFEEELQTNQEEKREKGARRKGFLQKMMQIFSEKPGENSAAALWLQEMVTTGKYGYQMVMREYGADEHRAEALVECAGNALNQLTDKEDERPLAVFAAELSGNPHYFDRGTVPGQLLVSAICSWKKLDFPENAHQWRKLLLTVGIIPDNVSSLVHVYGLRLRTEHGWHPAYEAFFERREPCVVTMENLKEITGAAFCEEKVYIVENEMVFSYLVSHRKKNVTLLCTSGQLRTAALELIPMLLAAGAEIFYSGDMDPDGLGIADRLWQRFGERIRIWRMAPEDYEHGLSAEQIDQTGLAKLKHLKHPLLQKTAECMKEKLLAAYQENILQELRRDIST